jgi:hypothetical protein
VQRLTVVSGFLLLLACGQSDYAATDNPHVLVNRGGGYKLRSGRTEALVSEDGILIAGTALRGGLELIRPTLRGQRIEFDRPRGITEWVAPRGRVIEHGFDVAEAPSSGDLVLRIPTSSPLVPSRFRDGFDFGSFTYSDLRVVDSTGKRLVAQMDWEKEQNIKITVPDEELAAATFPVIVDPLISTGFWFSEPVLQENAAFGRAVASAGDINNDGKGDIIIGVPWWDLSGSSIAIGRVYVTHGTATGLASSSYARNGLQADSMFGSAVAGVGDVNGDGYDDVVIGAPSFTNGSFSSEGRAYLYLGGSSGLASSAAWVSDPTDQANAHFGSVVTGVGDVNGDGRDDVVIAAPDWDQSGSSPDVGKIYLFYGNATTGLSSSAAWTSSGPTPQAGARFGAALAGIPDCNNDTIGDLLVGAPTWDSGSFVDEGSAHVYLAVGGTFLLQRTWEPANQSGAHFGAAVSGGDLNGDGLAEAVVAAPDFDITSPLSIPNVGKVWAYVGQPGGPGTSSAWTDTGTSGSFFGTTLSAAGDVDADGRADLLVGAPYVDNTATDEGAAYLYRGQASGVLTADPTWSADPTNVTSGYFGWSLAIARDVDQDGADEALIGAPDHVRALDLGGKAYLYYGGVDADADDVLDDVDNCPTVANTNQLDTDTDDIGDACECLGVTCTPLDACHLAGTCDPTTGDCSDPIKPECTVPPTWPAETTLAASEVTETSLRLTWSAATHGVSVENYRVYQDGALIDTLAGSVLTRVMTGLSPATDYSFQIQAGDLVGNWSVDGPSILTSTAFPSGGTGAPPLNPTVPTPLGDSVEFLYTGADPVQAGVTAAIEDDKVGVLRGLRFGRIPIYRGGSRASRGHRRDRGRQGRRPARPREDHRRRSAPGRRGPYSRASRIRVDRDSGRRDFQHGGERRDPVCG